MRDEMRMMREKRVFSWLLTSSSSPGNAFRYPKQTDGEKERETRCRIPLSSHSILLQLISSSSEGRERRGKKKRQTTLSLTGILFYFWLIPVCVPFAEFVCKNGAKNLSFSLQGETCIFMPQTSVSEGLSGQTVAHLLQFSLCVYVFGSKHKRTLLLLSSLRFVYQT